MSNFNSIDDCKIKSPKAKNSPENEKIAGYFIMEKFDLNVEQFFSKCSPDVNMGFVFKMAHDVVDAFEVLHATARTYNDLKP